MLCLSRGSDRSRLFAGAFAPLALCCFPGLAAQFFGFAARSLGPRALSAVASWPALWLWPARCRRRVGLASPFPWPLARAVARWRFVWRRVAAAVRSSGLPSPSHFSDPRVVGPSWDLAALRPPRSCGCRFVFWTWRSLVPSRCSRAARSWACPPVGLPALPLGPRALLAVLGPVPSALSGFRAVSGLSVLCWPLCVFWPFFFSPVLAVASRSLCSVPSRSVQTFSWLLAALDTLGCGVPLSASRSALEYSLRGAESKC